MNSEELRNLLYQKAVKEQSEYIECIKKLPPEQIVDKAYEIVMRDDILMVFENESLSEEQVMELIKSEHPLAECCEDLMSAEWSYMEQLADVIDSFIKRKAEL